MRNFKIIPFIFLLSALYFLPSLANADITTGLVGYWNFDEGSGTVVSDFSGNNNNASLVNGSLWVAGKIGNAVSFDGIDDKVDAKNISIWDLANTNHSLSLWFKASTTNSGYDFLVDRFTGGTPGAGYLISFNQNDSINFSERADGGKSLSITDYTKNYKDDTWHHTVVIVDVSSKTGTLYVDGVNKGTDIYTGNLINQNKALTFGNDYSNNNYAYSGYLDSIRIYNRVLSSDEILELYNYYAPETIPPVRSNGSPTQKLPKGITSATLSLNTNENSNCKYSSVADVNYDTMQETFSVTGELFHSAIISGLNDGDVYSYYFKCKDSVGNVNTDDYKITFTVGPVTYYLATNGNDNNDGSAVSPWITFSYSINQLKPGDMLIVKDGIYYQTLDINISGTQTEPIIIRSENDGMAIIDGQENRLACNVAGINNNDHIHDIRLDGFVCINSLRSAIIVNNADRIVLKKISAANAGSTGNYHVFDISYATDILAEDVIAYGTGRQSYDVYESNRVTLRRCWGKWEGHAGGGGPNGFIQIYGSDDSIVENCIGTMKESMPDTVQGIVVWANTYNDSADRNKIYGNIVYNLSFWAYANSSAQHLIQNNEFYNNVSLWNKYGLYQRADRNMLIKNYTCANTSTSCYVLQTVYKSGNCSSYDQNWAIKGFVKNSSFLFGDVGIQNDSTSCGLVSFNNLYNNLYNFSRPYLQGASLGLGEISVDPNYSTSTYGNGAYLKKPSNLIGKGENGENIGAEVLYRYVNGELTSELLWPWPMEDRICRETGNSVTYENNNGCSGGLWRTLEGVYPSSSPSSSVNSGGSGGGSANGAINPGISAPGLSSATTTATSTDNFSSAATTTTNNSAISASAAPNAQHSVLNIQFIKPLKFKSEGEEVKQLQQILNSLGFVIAKEGAGSKGSETNHFGSLTREAVKKFQCQHNIVCSGNEQTTGHGLLGPQTREKLNELSATTPSTSDVEGKGNGAQSVQHPMSNINAQKQIINLKQQLIELMMQVIEMLNNKSAKR